MVSIAHLDNFAPKLGSMTAKPVKLPADELGSEPSQVVQQVEQRIRNAFAAMLAGDR